MAAATKDLGATRGGRHGPGRRRFACSERSTRWRTSGKGGRVGSAKALLGSLLSIKPIIEIRDGVVEAESRQRTRTRSLEYLVDQGQGGRPAGRAWPWRMPLPRTSTFSSAMLAGHLPPEEILVSYIGPVIGTHAGPGCIGVCYRLADGDGRLT